VEKRQIKLHDDSVLEVEFGPDFLSTIREKFEIEDSKDVTDEDIRNFIFKSFKSSLDNMEKAEHTEETLPTEF
jgi:hypothetical protein